MKIKTYFALICFILIAVTPVLADEGGAKDTVDMVLTVQPDSAAGQLNVQLQLWVFDDADTLNGVSMGFGWDNPKTTDDWCHRHYFTDHRFFQSHIL